MEPLGTKVIHHLSRDTRIFLHPVPIQQTLVHCLPLLSSMISPILLSPILCLGDSGRTRPSLAFQDLSAWWRIVPGQNSPRSEHSQCRWPGRGFDLERKIKVGKNVLNLDLPRWAVDILRCIWGALWSRNSRAKMKRWRVRGCRGEGKWEAGGREGFDLYMWLTV